MNHNPSSQNFVRAYLTTDSPDLLSSLNGYFVMLGGTPDEVSLYRQTGTATTILIDGLDGTLNTSTVDVKVKVLRSSTGNWELFRQLSSESEYVSEGTAIDATHASASYFGMYVRYSSSNKSNYFFDDINVDDLRLSIKSASIKSSSVIDIDFDLPVEESSSENIANYAIDNGVSVLAASRSASNDRQVRLTVDPLATDDYQLTVSNVGDEFTSTTMPQPVDAYFSYTQLTLSEIITPSSTELKLLFNDDLDETAAEAISNYAIDGGIGTPVSAVLNPSNTKEVSLTLGTALGEQGYELSLPNGLLNASGNSQIDPGASYDFDFAIPLIAESVQVTSKSQLLVSFNKPVATTPALTTANYIIDQGTGPPAQVAIGSQPHQVVLTLGTHLSAADYSLTIAGLTDAGAVPLSPDPSVLNFSYLPLGIESVAVTGENTLSLDFNQAVDEASATQPANYLLDDAFGHPAIASLSAADASVVELTFAEAFLNHTYQLTVNDVANASSNALAENIIQPVPVSKATPAGALIITEILADPNPKGISPDPLVLPTASGAEFVEIHNPGTHAITINGFNLTGGTIGSFTLPGGGYVALVPASFLADYQALGHAVSVASWNTLTNTGEVITLKDHLGNAIDEVNFSSSWMDDSNKDGGWSLEKINPRPACESSSNWQASIDVRGASPGIVNSVFDDTPDTTPPTVTAVEIPDNSSLLIRFNEKMDTQNLSEIVVDVVGVGISAFSFADEMSLKATLEATLQSEKSYTLQLTGLKDCAGIALDITTHDFYYDVKPPVLQKTTLRSFRSLLLTFDEPLKKTDAEKEANYQITELTLAPKNASISGSLLNEVLLEFPDEFLIGQTYQLQVSGLKDTLENLMEVAAVLDFQVDQHIDSVWLEGPNYLRVSFTKGVFRESMLTTDNYRLDGKVTPAKVLKSGAKEARLIFSDNFSENKDLVLSVANLTDEGGATLITPDYVFRNDTRAPVIASVQVTSTFRLAVAFDEPLLRPQAEALSNYTWTGRGFPTQAELSNDQKTVGLTFANRFPLEQTQELAVVNLKDRYGNVMSRAIKAQFTYDTLAPRVGRAIVTSPMAVEVTFSEPVTSEPASKVANYTLAGSHPAKASRLMPDSNRVELVFAEAIPGVNGLVLSIDSLSDFFGNAMQAASTTFSNEDLQPGKATVISENKVAVHFNRNLKASVNNSNAHAKSLTSAKVQIGGTPHVLVVEVAETFADGTNYTLFFNGLTGTEGEALGLADSISFTYQSFLSSVTSNDAGVVQLRLTVPVNTDSLAAVSAMRVMPVNTPASLLLADADDPLLVRTFFDQPLPANESLKLIFSDLYDVWGRRIPDQSVPFAIDTQPPVVDSVHSLLFRQVLVRYSESVSAATALSPNHYAVVGIGNPKAVAFSPNNTSSVVLSFEEEFTDNVYYQLAVRRVEDVPGNEMIADTSGFQFRRPKIPQPGQILITEIMADPTPAVGLPEVEYVELYNASEHDFDLSVFQFFNDAKAFDLGQGSIPAGQYYLLCASADKPQLTQFGPVNGLPGWSALSNAGDSLTLVNYFGDIIDQVVYTSAWYKDSQKDDGGYSLERILGDAPCGEDYRWSASKSDSGGTPGSTNSLQLSASDSIAPVLVSIVAQLPSTLTLAFSEWMDATMDHLTVTVNGSMIDSIKANQTGDLVELVLAEALTLGGEYQVTVQGARDCSGNEMEATEMVIGLGRLPAFGELVISEVMPDPDPSKGLPEVEYIEILNTTADWLSYDQVKLVVGAKETAFPKGSVAPGGVIILCSSGSAAQLGAYGTTLVVPSFPSLKNDGDYVAIFANDELLHQVTYDDGLFKEASKREGGWSLEIIDPFLPCAADENWTASVSANGGTPGQPNSVHATLGDGLPVRVTEALPTSDSSLLVRFSEHIRPSALSLSVDMQPTLEVASLFFAGQLTNEAFLSLNEKIVPGTLYTLSVNGLLDCKGNITPAESGTATFVLPSPSDSLDVVINEILFNPRSGGVDFVELYNQSDKYLDVKDWMIGNVSSSTGEPNDFRVVSAAHQLLAPGAFMVFTSSAATLKADYPAGKEETFLEVNLPTYPNAEGGVIVRNNQGLRLDRLDYSEDFHSLLLADVKGVSLERISLTAATQDPENWESAAGAVGFATPGYMNSRSQTARASQSQVTVEPKSFIPGGDELSSYTNITFDSSMTNAIIDAYIFDMTGRMVKTLVQGQTVADGSFFRWDGSSDRGEMVRVGLYIVQIEFFNALGHRAVLRNPVAVGGRF